LEDCLRILQRRSALSIEDLHAFLNELPPERRR
jgi:hypothetical protein